MAEDLVLFAGVLLSLLQSWMSVHFTTRHDQTRPVEAEKPVNRMA